MIKPASIATQGTKSVKKEYLKGWISYTIMRYWVYGLFTIIALIVPWIKVNDNHIFLLSFDHKKLHLVGVVFDMQELLPLLFLLLMLFVGVFAMTAIGGRAWCGWACPQTIFRVIYRDLIETKLLGLHKRIKNKQHKPDMGKPINVGKKVLAILIWSALSLLAAANFMWFFVPPEEFFQYIQNPSDHGITFGMFIGLALFLIADVVFIKEDFCIYMCPYSRIQSVLYDDDTIMAVYNPNRGGDIYEGEGNARHKVYSKKKDLLSDNPAAECVTCESCVTICPTHIDIRKGLQLECINCLECIDACTIVMGSQGKPSLIEWSSEHEVIHGGHTSFKRPKVLAYLAVLGAITIGLIMAGTTKEHMLLNINKSTRLYKVVEDGKVENIYTFLFQNTDNKKHRYYFEVQGVEGIKIIKPDKPFPISAGFKKKKVVILGTDKILVKNSKQDTPIPITIKAYAVDDPEKIVVFRKSVFIYPRLDILEKKQGK
ncbi:MAG: cytochrome c oxidase accessory protein CcoG [Sulfurovum sp.]|nr:cytochrome c oxidase accessory protein CcoG [Sulfurovum sp.]